MPDIATFTEDEARLATEQYTLLQAIERARRTRKRDSYFLATGPYRRALYEKHMKFFAAGGKHTQQKECPEWCRGEQHRERCLLAANRTGKTVAAAFEVVCHLTGEYPDWWPGHRFRDPILAWVVNDTSKNTRDINQLELLGRPNQHGTGMIPHTNIIKTAPRTGIPDAVDSVQVKHITGGTSLLQFKSYEQGWQSFTGAAVHVIWCDEEPSPQVYAECCIRTMTTQGLILLTFTPLQGVTEVVKGFIDSYMKPEVNT